MSILTKPYEISVWGEEWDNDELKFKEKKLLTIGSNLMKAQCRASNPDFVTNVNGTKKLSFQMYKQYYDIQTGEKVTNPFYNYLTNERKVKLKYEGQWHDFVVKNVNENSDSYLCTYQLEDAFVNELSKNGFNVELSAADHSNLGTARQLAERVLDGTDWRVSNESEKFLQKNEEALVYLKINTDLPCKHLIDDGAKFLQEGFTSEDVTLNAGLEVLAFYSCCKDKPFLFQFIYIDNKTPKEYDDRRIIQNASCQYYIERNERDYTNEQPLYQFIIPDSFEYIDSPEDDNLVSYKYRGERYVFTQKTQYFSLLDSYLQEYTDKNGNLYYGRIQTDYIAPTLINNLIDNTTFASTSGWTAGIPRTDKYTKNGRKPLIENKYGRWDGTTFVSIEDDWKNQKFKEDGSARRSYLHITTTATESQVADYGCVINSGFYSNRTSLGKISPGEKFVFRIKMRDAYGNIIKNPNNYFTLYLNNINYNSDTGLQMFGKSYGEFDTWEADGEYCTTVLTITNDAEGMTNTIFKNLKIKLAFIIKENQDFYIEDAQLFKYVKHNNSYLKPDDQALETAVTKTYKLYTENDLKTIKDINDLPVVEFTQLDGSDFKPSYSSGAEKVRILDAKESNYFNILQSIAEKFEAWLLIDVKHDNNTGEISEKKIAFKNYFGRNNYAGFKYGVNLAGIDRQMNTQKLATKLIVKNNKNEFAENKSCSISNATSNETGENYLYNFDYYTTKGLLNPTDLDTYLYKNGCKINGYQAQKLNLSSGGDIGYYTYLSFLNSYIRKKNAELTPLLISQNSLKAKQVVAKEGVSAATDELEAAMSNFEDIASVPYPVFTGVTKIEDLSMSIECEIEAEFGYDIWITMPENTVQMNTSYSPFSVAAPVYQNDIISITPSNPNYATPIWSIGSGSSSSAFNLNFNAYGFASSSLGGKARSGSSTNWYSFCEVPNIGYNTGSQVNSMTVSIGVQPGESIVAYDNMSNILESRSDCKFLGASGQVYCETPVGYKISSISLKDDETITIPTEEYKYENGTLSFSLTTDTWETLYGRPNYYANNCKKEQFTIKLEPIYTWQAGSEEYNALLERDDINKLLHSIDTLFSNKREHSNNLIDYETKLDSLQIQISNIQSELQAFKNEKKIINQQFYSKYYKFIQEGTWVDEQYIDPELYYIDAQSVLYESCYPAVSYTIKTVEVSLLEGYELYNYKLGDKTYVEDKEFFGDDNHVEVVVTEISRKLDSPEQDSIKTQTYKNQFQDLFQKITATVQQAQYNTGAYKKAAAMTEASNARKQEYLNGAIEDLTTLLTNAGEATVEQTNTGIVVKEAGNKGNQMKLTGGALMIGTFDEESGETTWKSGMSTEGIAAEMITSGKLNTGELQIMNGNESVFRWDALGISAFDYQTDKEENYVQMNTNKFVRFDKHGLYGVNNPKISGVTWKPGSGKASAEEDITDNAAFKLTWDGLSLTPQNTVYKYGESDVTIPAINAKLGRVDENVYNDWDTNGFPVYNDEETHKDAPKFVKVFAVGDKVGTSTSEQFVLYSDGTIGLNNIKLTGDIQWTAASSPSKNVYGFTDIAKPADGTLYNRFPDSAAEVDNPETPEDDTKAWHKNYNEEKDTHYCHTDDGGATWQGPFAIGGQKGDPGEDAIRCYVESLNGNLFEESSTSGNITFTARIYQGDTEIDPQGNLLTYNWYVVSAEGTQQLTCTEKELELDFSIVRNKSIYFEAN